MKLRKGEKEDNELLRLEIPMNNLVTMAVLDSTDDLLEEPASFVFWHLPRQKEENGS
jgi:hypothetical protein